MGASQTLHQPVVSRSLKKPSRQTRRTLREIKSRKHDNRYDFHFRTDRIFAVGHHWYFSTREDIDFGPYNKKQQAEQALQTFLMLVA